MSSVVTDTELGYLSGVTSAIQTQINGKTDNIAGRDSTTNLNTIYSNQSNDTVVFLTGQNESNAPSAVNGLIHIIISYRATASYGTQWCFEKGTIYYRSMSGGSWKSWTKII